LGKSRFLPAELRSKIIDKILSVHVLFDKELVTMVSDNWTDTKLIEVLEQRAAIFKLAGLHATAELTAIEGLQEEIAEYVLLEEIDGKKNSGNRR
jgi:hypothetical protein